MTCTLDALPAVAVTPVGAPGARPPSSSAAPLQPQDATSSTTPKASTDRGGTCRTAPPSCGRHHGKGPDQYGPGGAAVARGGVARRAGELRMLRSPNGTNSP